MNRKIGVLDSGIGGFTILEELEKELPNESFIYYKDSKNIPYGDKTEEEIYLNTKKIIEELIKQNVKLIVIACNSISTILLKKIKEEYKDIIFIGTVPPIKVACDKDYKNILVMATKITVNSNRIKEIINDNKKDKQNIILLDCSGLVELIEKKDNNLINDKLNKIFKDYLNTSIDCIVLGCTHYPLIKENISNIFRDATILESTDGVVKEVKRQLNLNNLQNFNNKQTIEIIDYKG